MKIGSTPTRSDLTFPPLFSPIQPNKLCVTVAEAKSYAAEFVLSSLGVDQTQPQFIPMATTVLPPTATTYQVVTKDYI